MTLLHVFILILVCINAVLKSSSFRMPVLAGISLWWGGVMAGLIWTLTETTINLTTVWNIARIGLLLESSVLLVGCFGNRNGSLSRSVKIIDLDPGLMLWWPLLVVADQIIRHSPGVSFGGLTLAGGAGTALFIFLALSGSTKILANDTQKQPLLYLVNLFILLTIILSDGISI